MANQPWDRQPDEGEEAYAAFSAFRDSSPPRNVLAVFRQLKRKPHAIQVDGTWNGWRKRFRWKERARAYDKHFEDERLQVLDRAARAAAEDWVGRGRDQVREDYDFGRKLYAQAKLLVNFPVVRKRAGKGDSMTIVEPVGTRELRDAAAVAEVARQMVWDAIERGLGQAATVDADAAVAEAVRAVLLPEEDPESHAVARDHRDRMTDEAYGILAQVLGPSFRELGPLVKSNNPATRLAAIKAVGALFVRVGQHRDLIEQVREIREALKLRGQG